MPAPWYDPDQLPRFDRPPVFETALAVEFGPVTGLDFYRLTKLQELWADEYPTISDVPGAPPTPLESTGEPLFFMGQPPKRIWAAALSNGQLLQTQSDRLILNWRKNESQTPYPGYHAHLRGEYERLWALFTGELERIGLPLPIPTLAEFTYINVVPLQPDERLQDVLTIVRSPDVSLPGRDRFTRFQLIRDVSASDEDPFTGQIHIMGEPQPQPDGSQALVFTIIGRAVLGAADEAPLAGLDAAHALASHTFARMISEDKKKEWGQTK